MPVVRSRSPTKKGVTPTVDGVNQALAGTGLTNPKVKVNGRDVTVTVDKLPDSPVQSVATGLGEVRGNHERQRRQRHDRRPHLGA